MSSFIFSSVDAGGNTDLYATDGTAAGTIDLEMGRFGFSQVPEGVEAIAFMGKLLFLMPSFGDADPTSANSSIYTTTGTEAGTTSIQIPTPSGVLDPAGLWAVNGLVLTSGGPAIGGGLWASPDGLNFTKIGSDGTYDITVSNGIGYFDSGPGDDSLWRTDGTAAGTYSINSVGVTLGSASFAALGSRLTLFSSVGADGTTSLWQTDGTASGTSRLDIPALSDTNIAGLFSYDGKMLVSTVDANLNYGLWVTDGTASGTTEILSGSNSNPYDGIPAALGMIGNKMLLSKSASFSSAYALSVTDGTAGGTVAIAGAAAVLSSAVLGSKVLFTGAGIPGDAAGTYSLSVYDVDTGSTTNISLPDIDLDSSTLTLVGNRVVFAAQDGTGSENFYSTDGTQAGTRQLALPAGISLDPDQQPIVVAEPDPVQVQPVTGIITLGGGTQSYDAAAGTTVQGGSGTDTITATAGGVTVLGGSGQLKFLGGTSASSVSGGSGSATIFGGSGGGSFTGGEGGHNILVSQGAAGDRTTLTGAAAGDRIFGSAGGTDILVAGAGRESLLGGGGLTTIDAGSAASVIFAGAGSTTVNGGAGAGDTIVGGTGSLSVMAQDGDAIFGSSGALSVTGSHTGADSIVGGTGALAVTGTGGNMLVVAGSGTSTIDTGNGASLIFSGSGTSTITGGTGSMQLVLGPGKATIDEGAGPAVYDVVKGTAGGLDILNGFEPGTDRINFFGYQPSDLQVSSVAGSTLLSLADGTRLQWVGVADPQNSITI